jgi:hypothetical protein
MHRSPKISCLLHFTLIWVFFLVTRMWLYVHSYFLMMFVIYIIAFNLIYYTCSCFAFSPSVNQPFHVRSSDALLPVFSVPLKLLSCLGNSRIAGFCCRHMEASQEAVSIPACTTRKPDCSHIVYGSDSGILFFSGRYSDVQDRNYSWSSAQEFGEL